MKVLFLALSALALGLASAQDISDADVLTFAYNLEVLEGQFYSCAVFGRPLDASVLGGGGQPSNCKKANISAAIATYANELARDESAHVALLYGALKAAGASPVAPAVNIDTAFEAAAEAAFNTTKTLSPLFDPYANDAFFLHAAFIFEDLGASAYLGARQVIKDPNYETTAGQIGNAESYHSSLIRSLLFQQLDTVPAYGQTAFQITSAIVDALNRLTGPPQLKWPLRNANGSSIVNVDPQALVPVASYTQVLRAVTFGAPKGQGGGFFPQNLQGTLKN